MNPTSRSETLDIAKGIGIILVVLGHSWLVLDNPGILFQIIYSFHVPLFFFLSGIFVKENIQTIHFIFNKAESLLKPYLAISLLIVLFSFIKSHLVSSDFSFSKNLIDIVYASGGKIVSTPTWFLPSLFITLIALIPLTKLRKNSKLFLLIVLLITSMFFNIIHEAILPAIEAENTSKVNYLPWSIDLLPVTLFFVFSGFVFKDYFLQFNPDMRLLLLALLIYILILSFIQTPALNLHIRNFGTPFFSLILAFTGIYLTIAISYYIARLQTIAHYLKTIGESTLFILIIHGITLSFLTRNFDKVFTYLPLSSILGSIFSIIIPIAIYKYTQKNQLLRLLFLPKRKTIPLKALK